MQESWLDYSKSIQELENDDWGEPDFHTSLVETCHRLRRKQLKDFTTEDLRVMIGQNIGLKYLVPMSIEILDENIFAKGDCYAGDILESILRVEHDFWMGNPLLKSEIEKLILENIEKLQKSLEEFKKK